ncbi:glycoside hydrolase family 2 TIM barrel-domain containing protein [Gracilibacillus thailandensis]|uniref:DUF4982 domain-containing protein n=1 Tax=Gracilibacillus thailandensis TaxID=563735 RepID=A0A6N7QZ82_9BACI|nr:glycoside hydrolase family 2 TIM barrel-domain containing protein [Gracilibacillus thailandensis]MRI67378.1 DUF4982 domain-containing protein [Gracilibacillus thailandensis]
MNNSRLQQNLNLDWKFYRGDEPKAWYKGFDDSKWRNISLPHDWSVEEPFSQQYSSGTGYVAGGVGWYRKAFKLPANADNKKVFITFEGIYNHSQVWCNSNYLGKRPFGYSTFTYDITEFVKEDDVNVISVKVNHKDVADSRWFTGSGIYRDVYVTITDPVHVDQYGVFVTTPQVSNTEAIVQADTQVVNEQETAETVIIQQTLVNMEGERVGEAQESITVDSFSTGKVEQQIKLENPALWSPDHPHLYQLVTEVVVNEEVKDEVITTTGIRSIAFDAKKGFFLNQENMKIKGVCIHHDAGGLGAAVPKKVWVRRLKALKEMGCNAIRTAHNPPAPHLLDLCDELGFLVMDEAFDEWEGVKNKWAVGHNVYPPEHYGYYEDFPQWGEMDLKEMVLRDRNHPSIIMWSIGNEIDYPNDPYCHPSFQSMTGNNDANKPKQERIYDPDKPNAERLATISKQLVHYVKECDTTRPVTSALAYPELSNLTGYAQSLDVVGYNYKEHLYKEDINKYPNHVIYGSENSPGLEDWLIVKDNDEISGQFIWTGIDYLGEAKGWPVRASPAGFLDLAGNKKSSFYYRKSLWSDKPMVYLAAKPKDERDHHSRWKGDPHWEWQENEKLEVFCYTNCEEAELFLNEQSLGVKRKGEKDSYLSWDVSFESGLLEVIAKDESGNEHNCQLMTPSTPYYIDMVTDSHHLKADGQDIAHIEMQITDSDGNPVYLADNEIHLSIEGPGELIGMENGNIQDLKPYYESSRKVYHGKLLAFVRAGVDQGEITLHASSSKLEDASITILVD